MKYRKVRGKVIGHGAGQDVNSQSAVGLWSALFRGRLFSSHLETDSSFNVSAWLLSMFYGRSIRLTLRGACGTLQDVRTWPRKPFISLLYNFPRCILQTCTFCYLLSVVSWLHSVLYRDGVITNSRCRNLSRYFSFSTQMMWDVATRWSFLGVTRVYRGRGLWPRPSVSCR